MNFDVSLFFVLFAAIVLLPKFKYVVAIIVVSFLTAILMTALVVTSGFPAPVDIFFSWLPVIPVGLIVRYVVRRLLDRKSHPFLFAAVNIAGFVIAVLAAAGPKAVYEQATMKSLMQCRQSTFPVTIGSHKFNLPGSPEFVVRDFKGFGNIIFGDSDNYQGSQRFQNWCSRVLNKGIELKDIAIGIEFTSVNDGPLRKDCISSSDGYRRSVCELHDRWVKRDTGNSVIKAFIFSKANEKYFFDNAFGMEVETKDGDGSRFIFEHPYKQECEIVKATNNPPLYVCTAHGLLKNELRYFIHFRSREEGPEKFGMTALGLIDKIVANLARYPASND